MDGAAAPGPTVNGNVLKMWNYKKVLKIGAKIKVWWWTFFIILVIVLLSQISNGWCEIFIYGAMCCKIKNTLCMERICG